VTLDDIVLPGDQPIAIPRFEFSTSGAVALMMPGEAHRDFLRLLIRDEIIDRAIVQMAADVDAIKEVVAREHESRYAPLGRIIRSCHPAESKTIRAKIFSMLPPRPDGYDECVNAALEKMRHHPAFSKGAQPA
jgi:hypothetical protein